MRNVSDCLILSILCGIPAVATAQIDFGDLPGYATLLENDAARHTIVSGIYLGEQVDAETNGFPSPLADGDDLDSSDDEDGVTFFTSPLAVGSGHSVVVVASTSGLLNAWIDFNDDGDWSADPGEKVFRSQPIVPGTNLLTFEVLPTALTNPAAKARFRFSLTDNGNPGGLNSFGLSPDGEVEDYVIAIGGPTNMDFGDHPGYGTLLADNAARHIIVPGIHLGALIDAETNGSPSAFSDGDDVSGVDDDDGVTFLSLPLNVGSDHQVSIVASTNGLLNGWIDFNNDGDWSADPGEKIFLNRALSPGTNVLVFTIPLSAIINPTARARFRFSLTDNGNPGGLNAAGFSPDGEVEDYAVPIFSSTNLDFGDHLGSNYATLLANDAARHNIVPGIHLGSLIDAETNGIPSLLADGDDGDGVDDEDGVTFLSMPLALGSDNTVEVIASTSGLLNAWIDFNSDGDWSSDPGEKIFRNELLSAGTNVLSFEVPVDAMMTNAAKARFRFSLTDNGDPAGLNALGFAATGEVEDYIVPVHSPTNLDYGDAPSSGYLTLLGDNGARHVVTPGVHLGALIDADVVALEGVSILGDDLDNLDDEDGVLLGTNLQLGATVSIEVIASTNGYLNAWVDFNADGDWLSETINEKIFSTTPLDTGTNALTFVVPAESVTNDGTVARFRFSTNPFGGQSFVGLFPDGEVEDYQVRIIPPLDSDVDGLPDWWELLYFGDPTNAIAADDEDGDNQSNYGEYIADTIPTNGASSLYISDIDTDMNPVFVVEFPSSEYRRYDVEELLDLTGSVWGIVQTNVPGIGGTMTIPSTNAADRNNFRIRAVLPIHP